MQITSFLLQAAHIETSIDVLEKWYQQSSAVVIDEYLKQREEMIAIPAEGPVAFRVGDKFCWADEPKINRIGF